MENNDLRSDLFPKSVLDKVAQQGGKKVETPSSLASKVFSAGIAPEESHMKAPSIFFLALVVIFGVIGALTDGLQDVGYVGGSLVTTLLFTLVFMGVAHIIRSVGEFFGKKTVVILWILVAILALGGIWWALQ